MRSAAMLVSLIDDPVNKIEDRAEVLETLGT